MKSLVLIAGDLVKYNYSDIECELIDPIMIIKRFLLKHLCKLPVVEDVEKIQTDFDF